MQQQLNNIGLILCVILFIMIGLLYPLINLKKERRSKQVLFPFFAFVYAVAAYILISRLSQLVEPLVTLLRENVSFVSAIRLDWLLICVLNIIVLVGFFIIKSILCLSFGRGRQKPDLLLKPLLRPFYEYDDGIKAWALKIGFVQFRRYFKVFYYMSILSSAILMLIMYYAAKGTELVTEFYPVLSIILLGEITFFLNGLTKTECINDLSGEDEDATTSVNYYPMREIYRKLFGDRMLCEDSKSVSDDSIGGVTETVDEMLASEDNGVIALGNYIVNRMTHGFVPDISYMNSSKDILLGKSILFSNPFYNDLSPYLFFPMNYLLMNRKKCLIILGRNSVEEEFVRFTKDGLAQITNVPDLWNVGLLTEEEQNIDVGILPRCELYNQTMLEANQRFFDEVSLVMIVEPSQLLSTFQMGLRLTIDRLCRGERKVTYCACDKNSDGLLDVLSHALRVSLSEVAATTAITGSNSFVCWNADGDYLHHRLFPNIAHYLGMGTELAITAVKNQVSRVSWYSGRKFPVVDMRWIDGQYYQQLSQYMNIPLSQSSIDKHIHFYPSLWDAKKTQNNFVIVEDEYCNLFEMLRQFSTRSTNQGFVNVISQNYMLRDYMCHNAELFYNDAKAIPAFAPEYAHTKRNLALKLIMELERGRLTEQDVEMRFLDFGLNFEGSALEEMLRLLEECFGICRTAKAVRIRDFDVLNKDGTGCCRKPFLVLHRNDQINAILNELQNAYYVSEDRKERKHFLGSRLCGHLYQTFIPGQFHTFAGKYYEIYAITKRNGMLIRRAADHIENRYSYRQLRQYSLANWTPAERIGNEHTISGIRMETGYADIHCETYGYLKLQDFHDLAQAVRVEVTGIPERYFSQKSVMRIDLPATSSAVRKTIAVLLNELFVTLYSDDWEYIAAVTQLDEGDNDTALHYTFSGPEGESIFIIEDSQLDIGLLASVERNIERYLEIIADYLSWHHDMLSPLSEPSEIPSALEDIPEALSEKPRKKFLLMRFFGWLKSLTKRFIAWIKNLFKRKRGFPPIETPEPADEFGAVTEAGQDEPAAVTDETIQTGEEKSAETAETVTNELTEETYETFDTTTNESALLAEETSEVDSEESTNDTNGTAEPVSEESALLIEETSEVDSEESANDTDGAAEPVSEESALLIEETSEVDSEESTEDTDETAEPVSEESALLIEDTSEAAAKEPEETDETAEPASEESRVLADETSEAAVEEPAAGTDEAGEAAEEESVEETGETAEAVAEVSAVLTITKETFEAMADEMTEVTADTAEERHDITKAGAGSTVVDQGTEPAESEKENVEGAEHTGGSGDSGYAISPERSSEDKGAEETSATDDRDDTDDLTDKGE